ncbi:MAG TPA: DUF3379 family protein [Gammaproteobacteria bacterium]|nr:DUF3379 family protein [Gammaproteobacteria bacterium]
MDCLEFRRLCEEDPYSEQPAFAAHAKECPACARQLQRARQFDALIGAALRIDVPSGTTARRAVHGIVMRRWLSLAAALVLAIGIGAGLWLATPSTSVLASDVVQHVLDEPEALKPGPALAPESVQSLVAQYGIRIDRDIGTISYVRLCPFEGKQVPHFVVESPTGPVTVMLLIDEHPPHAIEIRKAGFFGRIVPAGSGSIAILSRERVDSAEEQRIVGAVHWEA